VKFSPEFIKKIPKTDLHLHLDGSLRLKTLIETAKRLKIELPSYTEDGMRDLVFKDRYKDLGEYLHGFKYTCAVLRDLEVMEQVSYELAVDNYNEGVRYFEARFAPQLMMDGAALTMEEVFSACHKGFERAKKEFNAKDEVVKEQAPHYDYGIISCAMRMFGPKGFSPYYNKFYEAHTFSTQIEVLKMGAQEMVRGAVRVRDTLGLPIVAIDLAGQEAGYPAEYFREAYDYAHEHFMHKTVHAGEAYGAESIFQAIRDLHADRLGHGYYLFDVNKIEDTLIQDREDYINHLCEYIAEKRITIEVCLTSNMQTNPDLKNLKDHSFKEMLARKISCTLCTDNRLISNTTVTKEMLLATENFEIDTSALMDLCVYGLKRSFFHGTYLQKRSYVRSVTSYFKKIAQEHNVSFSS